MLLANKLSQCCCQCQKECFEQRNGINTLKGLSLIIHSSQKCTHTHFFSSGGVRVFKKKKQKQKKQRSQPKSSGFLFIKRSKTKKVNSGCRVVLQKEDNKKTSQSPAFNLLCELW